MLYLAAVIQVSARGVRGEMWKRNPWSVVVRRACGSLARAGVCRRRVALVVWRLSGGWCLCPLCFVFDANSQRAVVGNILALMAKTIKSRARQPTTFEDL